MSNLIGGPLDGEKVQTPFPKLWFRLDQLLRGSVHLWAGYRKWADGDYHYVETMTKEPQEVRYKAKGIGGAEVVPERYAQFPPKNDLYTELTVWTILSNPLE